MKYSKDFHLSDWIVDDMSLIPCKPFVEKVIFPHPDLLLHHAHRIHVLVYNEASEKFRCPNEFSFAKVLTGEERAKSRVGEGKYALGWCTLMPYDDVGIVAVDFFDTVLPGHNFGALMWDKIHDVVGDDTIVLPSQPIVPDYWIEHIDLHSECSDLISRKGTTEAARICLETLRWSRKMWDEIIRVSGVSCSSSSRQLPGRMCPANGLGVR